MAHVTLTLAPQWRNYILLEIDAKIKLIEFCRLDCYKFDLGQCRSRNQRTVIVWKELIGESDSSRKRWIDEVAHKSMRRLLAPHLRSAFF